MSLSDLKIKAAKPKDKAYKLTDEKGMYLLIHPNGGKYWRLDYRYADNNKTKRKTLAIGVYPKISLKKARELQDEALKQLAVGIDPSESRKAAKEAKPNTFETVTADWGLKKVKGWNNKHPYKRIFEHYLFPWIGIKLIDEVQASDIQSCLERIEATGRTALPHRALGLCGQMLRYAVSKGLIKHDVTSALRGSLTSHKEAHFPAITNPKDVGPLLRAIDGYRGCISVIQALKLAPLVFVRPSELRLAEWSQIDFEAREWSYQVSKTKVNHIVPLSDQAIAIIQAMKPYSGRGRYVFPSNHGAAVNKPLSAGTLNAALRAIGYANTQMSVHGFRATARTILDEVLKFRPDIIEHQLAHRVKDPNGRAYNRTAHLLERHSMMQAWSDYLDDLKSTALMNELC